jgi:hypothetical protein
MIRPDFVDFILKDVNSKMLKDYIKDLENKIENINEIVNNDKISGIEAKLIIKDLLGSDKD